MNLLPCVATVTGENCHTSNTTCIDPAVPCDCKHFNLHIFAQDSRGLISSHDFCTGSSTNTAGTRVGSQRPQPRNARHRNAMSMVSAVELTDAAVAANRAISTVLPSLLLGEEEASVGYSNFSYYTTLGLYALSFPGLWSVIKRATKTK